MKRILLVSTIFFASCNTPPVLPGGDLDVQFYSGKSATASIAGEKDAIQCSDPRFDEFACSSYSDIQKIYARVVALKVELERCQAKQGDK